VLIKGRCRQVITSPMLAYPNGSVLSMAKPPRVRVELLLAHVVELDAQPGTLV